MRTTSTIQKLSWAVCLTVFVYIVFLVGNILPAGTQRAVGIGIFLRILYDPLFWVTATVLFVIVFFWKCDKGSYYGTREVANFRILDSDHARLLTL